MRHASLAAFAFALVFAASAEAGSSDKHSARLEEMFRTMDRDGG